MRDFEAFYAAGAVANRGTDPYGRAIWDAEKTIPGVDTSHNETLPFVGPPAGLPLWRALATLPYDVAGRVWGAVLAIAMLVIIFGTLELVNAPRTVSTLLGATILTSAYGAVISDVSLGQVALVCAAAIVLVLLLLPARAWLFAALAAAIAALSPNLAVVLIASLTGLRALFAFAIAAAGVTLSALHEVGVAGLARYADLLRVHGAAEKATVIQITPSGILFGLGPSVALIVVALAIVALRRIREPAMRVGIASCALPFVVPFFHEHDFVLMLLPAMICAIRARGPALILAAIGATACGVDWLGLAQRPLNDAQTIIVATACALGFMLLARLRREAFTALAIPVAVAAVSAIARTHPVPIWPDMLPPHWQPPPGASVSEVWRLEQQVAGLDERDPVWNTLRALSLASCALLGFATYLTGVINARAPKCPPRSCVYAGIIRKPIFHPGSQLFRDMEV